MIASMTGYGKAVIQLPTKKVSVEIKSLNSKNLDINVRIPVVYREKELEIRKKLANRIVRGKVTFGLHIETTGIDVSTKINTETVNNYIAQLKEIEHADNVLEIAMRLPESVISINEDIDPEEWKQVENAIDTALDNIVLYRETEGAVLKLDFEKRLKLITEYLDEVNSIDPERKESVKGKLLKAIADLKQSVDENRFEQELIYYLEKLDITEEQVRLKNHLEYFTHTLNTPDSNGKKLNFITQEIGREINTIGSKANYAPMQKIVVQMKDELEKIKEQNLNIL